MATSRRRAAIIAGALLALLAAATPAQAHGASKATNKTNVQERMFWSYPACMNATLSAVSWDGIAARFVVTGTATQCPTPPGPFTPAGLLGYRVATYIPGERTAWAPADNHRFFPRDAGLDVPVGFRAAAVPREIGTYGVCVIGSRAGERKVCAKVTVTSDAPDDHSATLEPIDNDAELVQLPHVETPIPWRPNPEDPTGVCGTCF